MTDLYDQYINEESSPQMNRQEDILHIAAQDPMIELKQLEKQMSVLDVITTSRAVRLEDKMRIRLDECCRTYGIGLDTLLEGMFFVLTQEENKSILEAAIKEAYRRRLRRLKAGSMKTAIARLKKIICDEQS